MKLTKWILGLLIVVGLMFAVGCSKDEKDSGAGAAQGAWYADEELTVLIFEVDSKGVISSWAGADLGDAKIRLKNGKVEVNVPGHGWVDSEARYKIDGKVMTWTAAGVETTFYKK